ncbi:MAG: PIG-L family deacetylase [Clostridia bacterium]|nr:PIG-L family deacetylase [Clostridia bacterium]
MSYLIVVAHPDDEVLGAGAAMYTLSKRGEDIAVCVMSSNAEARAFRPETQELHDDADTAMAMLGVKKIYNGTFPNIQLNTVPHLHLVQFIEKAIADCQPDVVITHHPSDLNNDHLHTSLACQAACRFFQRRSDIPPLQELWYMEVPSATDWGLNKAANNFDPSIFIEVGQEGIKKKLEALSMYRGVMRDYPHPRSDEAIEGLAAYRGSQAGVCYAEAFQCAMRRIV